jgi:ppGpp synthetase/RelA/SpoT-type nucleotidyltranferase
MPKAAHDIVVENAVANYEKNQQSFKTMAQHVHDTIRDRCDPQSIHNIEFRAKRVDKFRAKALKVEDGAPKYSDPLNEITDLAGVRVIVFVKDTVPIVCRQIAEMYVVKEQEDVGERVYKQGRFGYQSIHILVNLDRRLYLGGIDEIRDAVCEIQVRTILQHAWAEMEHDIQYQGDQIPTELAKRFSALAGLLEIGDGEFQRIQADSLELHKAVQANLLEDLTQQAFVLNKVESEDGVSRKLAAYSARKLIVSGKYREALEVYHEKIKADPKNHTFYVGRAKVLFLLGDSAAALRDLDAARRLAPNDPVIARTRTLIENGDIVSLRQQGSISGRSASSRLQSGFAAIQRGDGVQAFDDFAGLEGDGYNRAFTAFNKAMACAVEEDIQGAREFMSALNAIPATPMSVNIAALKLILDVLEGKSPEIGRADVASALAMVPTFSASQSHLRYVIQGMRAKKAEKAGEVEAALDVLGPIADD